MTVQTIKYTNPVTGTSTTNPTYISGSDTSDAVTGGLIGNDASPSDYSLLVADMTTRQLLEGIMIELKIMNLRQQEAFEETVNEDDVSCE